MSKRRLLSTNLFCLVIGLGAASCSNYQRVFEVKALNTKEEKIDCIVVVDDAPYTNDKGEYVSTPAMVTLTFKPRSDGMGLETIKLGVKFVVREGGKIVRGTKFEEEENSQMQYFYDNKNNSRKVQFNDAKTQLFILRENRAYTPAN